MKRMLRCCLISVLGRNRFNVLYSYINRMINKEKDKIKYNEKYVEKFEEYKVENRDTFFGYYDINPFSPDGSKLLTLAIEEKFAELGYFDLYTKNYYYITTSNCWNWQMGCRLRWLNDETIMFNDFDGEKFISRVCTLSGNEIARYPVAFFDFDNYRKKAFYLDFSTLHYYRPGYGYENIHYEKRTLNEHGLFLYDLEKQIKKLILPLSEINEKYPTEYDKTYEQYINHISINPYSGWIMFFQIWVKNTEKEKRISRIVVCDDDGNIKNILEDFQQVSHYWWRTKEELMLTVISNAFNVEYRLYNIVEGNYIIIQNKNLNIDGHPSYIADNIFITDTYPNKYSMQSIYVCEQNGESKKYFSIYHNPRKWGEYRCDLHPYYFNNMIHLDNNMSDVRSQMVLFLKEH